MRTLFSFILLVIFVLHVTASASDVRRHRRQIVPQCDADCQDKNNFGEACASAADEDACLCTQQYLDFDVKCLRCLDVYFPIEKLGYQATIDTFVGYCATYKGVKLPDVQLESSSTILQATGGAPNTNTVSSLSATTPQNTNTFSTTILGPQSASSTPIPTSLAPILPSSGPPSTSDSRFITIKNTDPTIEYSPAGGWATVAGTVGTETGLLSAPSCTLSGDLKEGNATGINYKATINYSFQGTGIAIHTVPSPLGGLYSISIDDDQEQQLDSYDPSVSIDSPVCSAPFSQQNLNPGLPHTVEIWVLGASPLAPPGAPIGQLDFDAFVITQPLSMSSGTGRRLVSAGSVVSLVIAASSFILYWM